MVVSMMSLKTVLTVDSGFVRISRNAIDMSYEQFSAKAGRHQGTLTLLTVSEATLRGATCGVSWLEQR